MPNPTGKRLILNLVLLGIVASLVAFIVMRNEDKPALYATLYDKSIGDEATEIIIHIEGSEDVVLKSVDGNWKVIQPEQFNADQNQVRHLFTLLSENAETSYDIAGRDLAKYGLDKDKLSISFNGIKLIFGDYNEVTQKRYVLKGEKMYLISETVSGLLEAGVDSFKSSENK